MIYYYEMDKYLFFLVTHVYMIQGYNNNTECIQPLQDLLVTIYKHENNLNTIGRLVTGHII